jgi:DNA-binding MarR family transcriptional regulator
MVVSMIAGSYIDLLDTRHALDMQLKLSAAERELIVINDVCDKRGMPLTVGDIVGFTHLSTPATLHRRLDCLVNKGMIFHTSRDGDRRTKYLVPGYHAMAYFERMADALVTGSAA